MRGPSWQMRNPHNPPEALGEDEGTETPGGNTGSGFVGSSTRPALVCEISLCLLGSVTEDSRRTISRELVLAEAGAELPVLVSTTGSTVLSPSLVAVTELGVLVRGVSGRLRPLDDVIAPSAGKRQSKMGLYILKYKQIGTPSSLTALRKIQGGRSFKPAVDANCKDKPCQPEGLGKGCSQDGTLKRAPKTRGGSTGVLTNLLQSVLCAPRCPWQSEMGLQHPVTPWYLKQSMTVLLSVNNAFVC